MSKRTKLALTIYWSNAIVMLVVGIAFVTAQKFFPFHSDVVGLEWSQIDDRAQILYLGMMRTEGAGYLATTCAMAFLLLFPLKDTGQTWAVAAVTMIPITEHFPTLLATYHVAQKTPASPPWEMTLACIFSLLLAAWLFLSHAPRQQQ